MLPVLPHPSPTTLSMKTVLPAPSITRHSSFMINSWFPKAQAASSCAIYSIVGMTYRRTPGIGLVDGTTRTIRNIPSSIFRELSMSGSPNSATDLSPAKDSSHRAARNSGVTTKATAPLDADAAVNPRSSSSFVASHARVHAPTANSASGKNLTFDTLVERPKPAETRRNACLFTVPSVAFLPLEAQSIVSPAISHSVLRLGALCCTD